MVILIKKANNYFTSHCRLNVTIAFTSHFMSHHLLILHHTKYFINLVFKDGIKATRLLKFIVNMLNFILNTIINKAVWISLSFVRLKQSMGKTEKNQLQSGHPTKCTFGKSFGSKITTLQTIRPCTKPNQLNSGSNLCKSTFSIEFCMFVATAWTMDYLT